ncbi:hypothetical protein BH20GEM1_BH20GEM1_17860 [soil metagenome]
MRRIGIGLLVVIAIILVMALCFDAFESDEAEIEVEERRAPAVQTLAHRPAGLPSA